MFSLLICLLSLISIFGASSSAGKSVLVVLDPVLRKSDFSLFFGDLEERGYNLSFRNPEAVTPAIVKHDVPAFSHVILFVPHAKSYAEDITPTSLIALLAESTNLMVALSTTHTPMTSLASEFSLILPPPGTPLVSHFPLRDGPANIIPIDVPKSHPILTSTVAPVWFSGIPHALGSNPYLVPILKAPSESFAADANEDLSADALTDAAEKGGEGLWAGQSLGVVSGFQTKSNSRVLWVGGVEMFTNAFMDKMTLAGHQSGNRAFARDVSAWVFQESLVLRIDSTTHHHLDETTPRDHYTINDKLVFTAHISRFDAQTSRWIPYAGLRDLQLEFTMLDPHIRVALPSTPGSPGKYSVTFRAPDRHGVFKFALDYRRKGWTSLYSSTTVSIVPPRHDGYPRFVSAAWPYYVGAISTSVAFLLFSALWLGGDVRDVGDKGKAKAE